MGAGGEVNEHLFLLRVHVELAHEAVQLLVDLFEIPGVVEVEANGLHEGPRRNLLDVFGDNRRHVCPSLAVQQHQTIDLGGIVFLEDRHGGTPLAPAPVAAPSV